MDAALLIARLILAVVFVVAGLAKLMDSAGSRKAVADFGIPVAVADPIGILLPIAEIAIAVLLIPTPTAWWAAVAALVLVLLFIGGISYNLAKGRTPDCHCFGQLHSEPVGWPTLARNGVLGLIAAFILWQGYDNAGTSAVHWFTTGSAAAKVGVVVAIVALFVAAIEGWTIIHLLGQNGRVLLRLDEIETALTSGEVVAPAAAPAAPPAPGLPVGSPAPAFSLSGLHGETMTLDALRAAGKPMMLLFTDPGCGPCSALLPELGKWQREHAAKLTLAIISRGTVDTNKAKSAEHGLSTVLLQKDREVAQAYQAHGTPSAVLVTADGTIASPVSGGADGIRTLLTRAVGAPAPAPAPQRAPAPAPAPAPAANGNGANGNAAPPATQPGRQAVGQPAPAVALADLDGKHVSLADFKGDKTVVLFWNPGCGFCRRMNDDLKAWEANPQAGAPKLLVVSTGAADANREMGIKSPMLLDEGFNVGRSFGASGTPSAVMVDEQGNIGSGVAVGAPGVLALLTGQPVAPPAPAAAQPQQPAGPKVGQPAPVVKLPDLDGKQLSLGGFKGHKTMVLFWNPGCGFCRRMLDDLKAWEAQPPKGAPKLLVVSTGTAEANREMGIKAPTLLDEGFTAGRSFGATGTPSAVLIDAQGKIASEVAVGADAVFALAGSPKQPATI